MALQSVLLAEARADTSSTHHLPAVGIFSFSVLRLMWFGGLNSRSLSKTFFRGGGRGIATASAFGYRQLRRARLLLESGPERGFQSLAGDLDGGTDLRQSGFQPCRSLRAGWVVMNLGCMEAPRGRYFYLVCVLGTCGMKRSLVICKELCPP